MIAVKQSTSQLLKDPYEMIIAASAYCLRVSDLASTSCKSSSLSFNVSFLPFGSPDHSSPNILKTRNTPEGHKFPDWTRFIGILLKTLTIQFVPDRAFMGILASKNKVDPTVESTSSSSTNQNPSSKAKRRWKDVRQLHKFLSLWRRSEEDKISKVFKSYSVMNNESGSTSSRFVIEPESIKRALAALGTPINETDIAKLASGPTSSGQPLDIRTTPLDHAQFKELAENAIRWRIVETVVSHSCLNAVLAPFLPRKTFDILNVTIEEIIAILRNETFINGAAEAIHKSLLDHAVEPTESEESPETESSYTNIGWNSNQEIDQIESQDSGSFQMVLKQLEKFQTDGGFIGKFGDKQMFDHGLEAEIGLADPFILKAILHEHMDADDSDTPFMSSHYGTKTTPLLEFSRLLGTKDAIKHLKEIAEIGQGLGGRNQCIGQTKSELEELQPDFDRLDQKFSEIKHKQKGIFSGEVGDTYDDALIEAKIKLDPGGDAKLLAENLNKSLTDTMINSSSILDPLRLSARCADISSAPVVDGSIVRVILSVPLPPRHPKPKDSSKATEVLPKVRDAIQLLAGTSIDRVEAIVVKERSFVYCEYGDEQALQKVLAAKKDSEIRKLADKEQPMPAYVRIHRKSAAHWTEREACVERIVRAFNLKTEEMRKNGQTRRQGRRRLTLQQLMEIPQVKDARLSVEEAIVAYQYTGPLFKVFLSQSFTTYPSTAFHTLIPLYRSCQPPLQS
jgi:hypothetical protein